MKYIPLSQGQVAFIDDQDFEAIAKHRWCANWSPITKSYCASRSVAINGKYKVLGMHREILGAKKGECVDHENHQTLDNRRHNLQITTYHGNKKNTKLHSNNTSGVTGVSWCNTYKKWGAFIQMNGKNINLGLFMDKIDAINARKAASEKHGFHLNHGKDFGKN